LKTRLPVRSALFKQRTGGLVVRWVTTSEYPLLYVFAFLFLFFLLKPLLVHSHQQSKVASHGIRIESDLRFFLATWFD
jgi:hypothetical protein